MEEEIDLRPHIQALFHQWKWIVGVSAALAILVYVFSSFLTPTYEATALVAVTEARQRVQFDPRFQAIRETQPLNAYPELAVSDQLMLELLTRLEEQGLSQITVADIQQLVDAESGSDPSLVRLSVRHQNAAEATRIVNIWAELFVRRANEIFGSQDEEQLKFFEEQLKQAEESLNIVEQALIDFQDRNRIAILTNQLDALNQTQFEYLAERRANNFLLQDIRDLRNQIAEQTTSNNLNFADQLTGLILQIKVFSAEFSSSEGTVSTPLQLQLSGVEELTSTNRDEQIVYLDALIKSLQASSTEIDVRLAELEPEILILQRQRQEIQTESERLIRDFELTQETYTALARKVDEERITSQDTSSGVRLASRAAVPENPVGPRMLLNTIIGGLLGAVFSTFGILLTEWWRSSDGLEQGKTARPFSELNKSLGEKDDRNMD